MAFCLRLVPQLPHRRSFLTGPNSGRLIKKALFLNFLAKEEHADVYRKMKKIIKSFLLLYLCLALASYGKQYLYACFYSRSAKQDLEINILNVTAHLTSLQVQIYDAFGTLLWTTEKTLNPYDATFIRVSQTVPENTHNWGLITILSTNEVNLALEYYINDILYSINLISQSLQTPIKEQIYVTNAYYTSIANSLNSVIIMNPWSQEVAGKLVIYDSGGNVLSQNDFTLNPFESTSVDLTQVIGQGPRKWGLVQVLSEDAGIVVACKFLKNGSLEVINAMPIAQPLLKQPIEPFQKTIKED